MTRVFVGYDDRQPLGYNVLQSSLHRHARGRVQVEPLRLKSLPIKRRGLTEFTYSRFLVPWLCDYQGVAIFMDADIVVRGDIAELAVQADGTSAVQVMQEQPRFEWSSVMLFNCAQCKILTPEWIENEQNHPLDLQWGPVGKITPEWNHCVGYMEPKPAKLYHFTQGLPCWYETQGRPEDQQWNLERDEMSRTASWADMMAQSVHAPEVIKRMLRNYGVKV